MLDRVAAAGCLRGWSPGPGLDLAYPLGGFLTHRILRADPRKIVLARAGVPIDSGNHRAPDHRPVNRPPIVVHHFKWRQEIAADLRRRADHLDRGVWRSRTPAMLDEARRFLVHLDRHDGHVAVNDPELPFRPVTLRRIPQWWSHEATEVVTTWRPPARCPR
ncbi:MAG: hypothetical protein HKP61_12270 [Dactylosporangium sp.]|nr:hypothetical protein [Dactylosporangium sp.]